MIQNNNPHVISKAIPKLPGSCIPIRHFSVSEPLTTVGSIADPSDIGKLQPRCTNLKHKKHGQTTLFLVFIGCVILRVFVAWCCAH
jgi:hypothetical protein